MAPEEKDERSRRPLASNSGTSSPAADGLAHGITIAVSIVLFLWLGDLLDERIGTSPVFALLGLLFGAGASFYRMYLHLVVQPREEREAQDEDEST